MGVPRFFKFLAERYPCIVAPLSEATLPTVDNLYLDMNGIIHNCTHKDDEIKAQLTEREMILKIFRYIDQLFQLIQPKKHFVMALDGVAPRAKMNQQRQRRFRKVFDAEQLRKKMAKKQEEELPPVDDVFDSNCITPGTEFMAKLSEHLKYMVHSKMKHDIKWQQCKVIFSGHDVPGEGEHKIMNFIRGRKMEKGYEPNERHCLYGLDADLICLGLITHEPHFTLLREDVFEQYRLKGMKEKNKPFVEKFHLLHLSALRQYLDLEFREALKGKLPFEYDLERIIDDFVFYVFFTGNDFLPHMPTLDIKEGSINIMMDIYKTVLPTLSGYLTEYGDIHFDRVEAFVKLLGEREASMMADRYLNRSRENRRQQRRHRKFIKIDEEGFTGLTTVNDIEKQEPKIAMDAAEEVLRQNVPLSESESEKETEPKSVKDILHTLENEVSPLSLGKHLKHQERLFSQDGDEEAEEMNVVVGLHNVLDYSHPTAGTYGIDTLIEPEGPMELEEENDLLLKSVGDNGFDFAVWHKAYYQTKLGIDHNNKEEVNKVVKSYVEGLLWVFKYYYNQLISWRWYYPFHYAPIATDLVNMGTIAKEINFSDPGKPFHPFEQLLGVLPEGSCKLLPPAYRQLYLPNSPIYDFYPNEFVIDREGTKYDYEGVTLLPFIDEKRLLDAVAKIDQNQVSEVEKKRNSFGPNLLFTFNPSVNVTCPSSLSDQLPDILNSHVKEEAFEFPQYVKFIPKLCDGVKENLEGFPSLFSKDIIAKEKDIGVALFGQSSKKPSMTIHLDKDEYQKRENGITMTYEESMKKSANVVQYLKKFIGKKVYVGYPYPRLGIFSSLADEVASYYSPDDEGEEHSERDLEQFRREYGFHKSVLLRRYGLDIGDTRVLVFIKLFRGMKRDKYGIKRSFNKNEFAYPHQLLILENYNPIPDEKFIERGIDKIEAEYPLGQNVLILGDKHYGCLGEVAGYNKNKLQVKLTSVHDGSETKPNYPPELLEKFTAQEYYPFFVAAKKLNMSKKALGIVVGNLRIELPNGKLSENVGLGLRSKKSSKRVIGYCRCDFNEQNLDEGYFLNFTTGNQLFDRPNSSKFSVAGTFGDWELSEKALKLIDAYRNAFPEFVEMLGTDVDFNARDMFPQITQSTENSHERLKLYQEKINEIVVWLSAQEFQGLPFIDIEKDVFPKGVLQEIEKAAIEFATKQKVTHPDVGKIVEVETAVVHKPSDPAPNLFYVADFSLGNRVLYMSGTGAAPYGSKGILVGMEGDQGQVVFDEEFVGGSTFGSRLSSSRGAILVLKHLVNLDRQKYLRENDEQPTRHSFSNAPNKVDYTKQHYYTTSSYNYNAPPKPKIMTLNALKENEKQQQKKPFDNSNRQNQGRFQSKNNNQQQSNFRVLREEDTQNKEKSVKQSNNKPSQFSQNNTQSQRNDDSNQQQKGPLGSSFSKRKPQNKPRNEHQPRNQSNNNGNNQQQSTQQTNLSPSTLASDKWNPSEVFKQTFTKHKQDRQRKKQDDTSVNNTTNTNTTTTTNGNSSNNNDYSQPSSSGLSSEDMQNYLNFIQKKSNKQN
ncbi:hypothetical protein ABK040_010988 [Willaertia magna]